MCPSSLVALERLEKLDALASLEPLESLEPLDPLAQPRSPSHFVASIKGSATPNLNPLTSPSPACRGEHKRVRDP